MENKTHLKVSDKDTIEAIKASISHWKEDIQKPLIAGRKIKKEWDGESLEKMVWVDTGKPVMCGHKWCMLCQKFAFSYNTLRIGPPCSECPVMLYHNKTCFSEGSHYLKFCESPCLETCDDMIKALEELL